MMMNVTIEITNSVGIITANRPKMYENMADLEELRKRREVSEEE